MPPYVNDSYSGRHYNQHGYRLSTILLKCPSYPSPRAKDLFRRQSMPRNAIKHQLKHALAHYDECPNCGDIHAIPSSIHNLLYLQHCLRLRVQCPRAQYRRLLELPSAQLRCPQGRFASPCTPCCTSCPCDDFLEQRHVALLIIGGLVQPRCELGG